jgi:Ca-activated chloride channel family protein
MVKGPNRVVLFTDGQANQGITDPGQLCDMARGACDDDITTTCIGFGCHFNEDLLEGMADAGGANYWYIEELDQMGPVFDREIEGLVSLVAQNATVRIRLTHPNVNGVTLVQDLPVERAADGSFGVTLGDVYATSARDLGLIFHVDNLAALGPTTLGEVEIKADVLTDQGIVHRTTTMEVVANLDAADHPDPRVDSTITRFATARARREALSNAERGDYDGAARALREASEKLSLLPATAQVAEEIEDLEAEAARMDRGDYVAEVDAKYHKMRARAMYRGKMDYIAQLSRRRKKKDGDAE